MKTILLLFAFTVTCSGQSKNCKINLDLVASVSKTIVKWLGNGYSTEVNPAACKNGVVYGDCLAGFLHDADEDCYLKYSNQEVLPKCTELFKKNKYSVIKSKISWLRLNAALNYYNRFLSKVNLNPSDFCFKLKSYVKIRISASEGGLYDKSKMASFCETGENKIVCNRWDDFLNDKVKYLKIAMGYLNRMTVERTIQNDYVINNENAIPKFIKALVEFALSSDEKDKKDLSGCLNQFVGMILEHMT